MEKKLRGGADSMERDDDDIRRQGVKGKHEIDDFDNGAIPSL